jgi:hypothetical protein
MSSGAHDGGDGGPDASFKVVRPPTPQGSAFGLPTTLYLSDKIPRCTDAVFQQDAGSLPNVAVGWFQQKAGSPPTYLAGSGHPYELAAVSTKPLYSGGSAIANKDSIVWIWRTGLPAQKTGWVRVSDGKAADGGAELGALASLPGGLYYLTVWAFDDQLKMVASSESRSFCLGFHDPAPSAVDAYDAWCGAPDGGGCTDAPSLEHPDP